MFSLNKKIPLLIKDEYINKKGKFLQNTNEIETQKIIYIYYIFRNNILPYYYSML